MTAPTTQPEDEQLRDKILAVLNEPQIENIPDDLWGTIYPTWTGLWTDYYGNLDEEQPSDIYAVSELLSDKRLEKLLGQLVSLIRSHDTARDQALLAEMPKEHSLKTYPEVSEYIRGYNTAISLVTSLLTSRRGEQS